MKDKIGAFDVIKYMSDTGDNELRLSPLSNIAGTDKKGNRCTITIGVDERTFNDISFSRSKLVGGLLIISSDAFDKSEAELKSETPSKEDSGLYTKEDMIGFAEYILNHTSGLPEHNYVGPEKLAKYELTHNIKKV